MYVTISELGSLPKIVLVDSYADGTIWWSMEDATGNRAVVCLDGRRGSPTQFRLLDGVRHPRRPGGRLLDLGSPEEGIVVPLLSNWLDAQRPKNTLEEYGVDLIRNSLLRLGEQLDAQTGDAGSVAYES